MAAQTSAETSPTATPTGPAVANDANEAGYVYHLSLKEKREVDMAMLHFKGLGLDGHQISPLVFPLPTLGKTLRALAAGLHTNQPFFTIRGLNPSGLTPEDTVLRYLGIASFVANKIGAQDAYGNVFAHIREAKYALGPQEDRPVRDSTLASHFHTDEACDILAMHTSGHAEEGGNHIVASSLDVYNILCQTRPDVIATLMAPIWHFDTRGRLAWGQARPLLFEHDGRVIFNFNRQALQGIPGIEPLFLESSLSLEQMEALNAVEAAARLVQIALHAEIGDITFVNNFSMLHARESFRDSPTQTRHLIRMWLKNSELAQTLPPPIAELNRRLFDESVKRTWNMLPKARLAFTFAERLGP
ncbi:hypothetical protein B0T16DRAFT_460656 [Cercophora newfieldiana]|uniref:TauD/TfdA-like domain-containing protein n=1 Tax=Cercophora newfieldiana TaxID=92897 RepID=A0AA39Y4C8_9PEZI|nr:hypothetical protein B0T16DRAFT_460656 [Cercophora newfieldiana]